MFRSWAICVRCVALACGRRPCALPRTLGAQEQQEGALPLQRAVQQRGAVVELEARRSSERVQRRVGALHPHAHEWRRVHLGGGDGASANASMRRRVQPGTLADCCCFGECAQHTGSAGLTAPRPRQQRAWSRARCLLAAGSARRVHRAHVVVARLKREQAARLVHAQVAGQARGHAPGAHQRLGQGRCAQPLGKEGGQQQAATGQHGACQERGRRPHRAPGRGAHCHRHQLHMGRAGRKGRERQLGCRRRRCGCRVRAFAQVRAACAAVQPARASAHACAAPRCAVRPRRRTHLCRARGARCVQPCGDRRRERLVAASRRLECLPVAEGGLARVEQHTRHLRHAGLLGGRASRRRQCVHSLDEPRQLVCAAC